MARKFNKTITTPEQMELYTEQKRVWEQYKATEKQKKENFLTYCKMEGKYSTRTVPDLYSGQGFRGYNYEYTNNELKAKEYIERQAYYAENVEPLAEKEKELLRRWGELDEALCIALWGYGKELYNCMERLQKAKKDLAEHMAIVEYWEEKVAELQR